MWSQTIYLLSVKDGAEQIVHLAGSPNPGRSAFNAAGMADGDRQDDQMVMGQMLGPYRIVQEIGRGGFATVFLAADSEGGEVAIKQFTLSLIHI